MKEVPGGIGDTAGVTPGFFSSCLCQDVPLGSMTKPGSHLLADSELEKALAIDVKKTIKKLVTLASCL